MCLFLKMVELFLDIYRDIGDNGPENPFTILLDASIPLSPYRCKWALFQSASMPNQPGELPTLTPPPAPTLQWPSHSLAFWDMARLYVALWEVSHMSLGSQMWLGLATPSLPPYGRVYALCLCSPARVSLKPLTPFHAAGHPCTHPWTALAISVGCPVASLHCPPPPPPHTHT